MNWMCLQQRSLNLWALRIHLVYFDGLKQSGTVQVIEREEI